MKPSRNGAERMKGEAVYVLGGLRTPIAHRGGALSHRRPEELGSLVMRALLARYGLSGRELSSVLAGNAVGTGGNLARLTALMADIPEEVPACTVDMQCASAAAAISLAAAKLASGQGELFLAGGMESASLQPLRVYDEKDPRHALVPDGAYKTAQFAPGDVSADAMLRGAERVMEAEHVTKEELDAFVLRSHHLAGEAVQKGWLADVILPVGTCRRDSGVRPHLSKKLLRRLPPHFGPGTLLDAGNACAIHDGAAFLLLASGDFLRRHHLKPEARLVATASVGGNPAESPRGAMRTADALLLRQGLSYEDLAAIEFNEAFAVIDALFERAHPGCLSRYNRLGGALAYGHPYGASGAILALHLMQSLKLAGGGLGLLSIAGAGGMGEAILLERLSDAASEKWSGEEVHEDA